jgi:hypothetical protein
MTVNVTNKGIAESPSLWMGRIVPGEEAIHSVSE